MKITHIHAREILDSRGFPTVEVELEAQGSPPAANAGSNRGGSNTVVGRAIVPSGASTGEGEALELRDGDKKRYAGKGVLQAVAHVRDKIAPAMVGREFPNQSLLDDALRALDGTPNKTRLGANAILPVSMAFCRAQALSNKIPVYRQIAQSFGGAGVTLPVPLMNILNGGKHADNGLAIQEFMIIPAGFQKFSEALRAGAEIFHRLKKILQDKGLSTGVGDEGGFAPSFSGEAPHEQAIQSIMQAITEAGYKPGADVFLALDSAASEFSPELGLYQFEDEKRSSKEMIEIYSHWTETYPIISIEDGLSEHDWEGWAQLTHTLGSRVQLVGDDIFVTNPAYLTRGIEQRSANAILIKLNQIGTVTETLETMKLAKQAKFAQIASHRSGESEDTFIADLAVGTDCGQIKTGSASRTDRVAKYNQLIRIEEQLGDKARFLGLASFPALGQAPGMR